MSLGKYRKGIIALAGFLAVLAKVLSDGAIAAEEIGDLFIAGGVALGVYRVPNTLGRNTGG